MTFKPKFSITNKIINTLTVIERVKGFLEAAVLSKEWIQEMQNNALVLEAHYTTHIEGTQLTLDQAEKIFAGKKVTNVNADDKKELLNYKDAFEFVSEYLDNHEPITEGLIREIHKKLVKNVRGGSAAPGEYRKIQNYVVNSKTGKTIYTPPPAYEVSKMMADLVTWLRTETKISPILIAGIAQFQLVHIHPFLDGNGRTARLLSTLYLYKSGYDFKRLFTISEFYDKDRLGYYTAIQSVRDKDMDMTVWLEYFTHALSTQMKEIRSKGELIIKTDILVKKYNLSDRQKAAINYLLKNKSMSIRDYEVVCPKINRRTLQRELKELIKKGIIETKGATDKLKYFLKI